jgi:hypothetical protein
VWILNTGAQWHMLPQCYPNYKHRRFEEECFIDATFVMAKGGGAAIGATKRGRGMKIMTIMDRHGLPLSVSTHPANHHEVRLVQLCFDF